MQGLKQVTPNFLALFWQRHTGECNDFKIKSGGFTYVIRLSGSDKRLTERIFCIHYFGAWFFFGG